MAVIFRARADRASYIVFTCLCLGWIPVCLISLAISYAFGGVVLWQRVLSPDPLLILIPLGALAFCFLWLRCYRITVEDGRVEFPSLFGWRKTIRLAEVKRAAFEIRTPTDFKGPFRLVVYYTENGADKEITFNAKVLSAPDIRKLLDILNGVTGSNPELSLVRTLWKARKPRRQKSTHTPHN